MYGLCTKLFFEEPYLRSKYASSCFLKVFSAALCVSRRSSAVTVISPQSALRYAEGRREDAEGRREDAEGRRENLRAKSIYGENSSI
jgi:hypothetical protein